MPTSWWRWTRRSATAITGLNMKRGFEAVLADLDKISACRTAEALKAVGMALVMKVGGASGPLYGTLFMSLGKALPDRSDARRHRRRICRRNGRGQGARQVRRRREDDARRAGAAAAVLRSRRRRAAWRACAPVRHAAAAATVPMRATRGRASFLGERSIGHMDPGARSSELIVHAILGGIGARGDRVSKNVGIVIVSHSPDVARGAADMVRQMVGDDVPLAWCGGAPGGGLGTSVESILAAIDRGMVGDRRGHPGRSRRRGNQQRNGDRAAARGARDRVVICDAPVVEGAVMAGTEASAGSTSEQVRRTAEELRAA